MALIGSGRRLLHHSPYIPANITGGRVISELSRAESQTFVRMKECTHKCTHNRTRFYSSLSFEEMCLRKMEMCWLNFCTSVDGNLSYLVKGKPLCGDSCWYYLSTLFIVCKNTKKKRLCGCIVEKVYKRDLKPYLSIGKRYELYVIGHHVTLNWSTCVAHPHCWLNDIAWLIWYCTSLV